MADPDPTPTRLTRRELTRSVLASATAAALSVPPLLADETPAPADQPRVAWLESIRGKPFTPKQRQTLETHLRGMPSAWEELRRIKLDDGGGEPAFTFRPLRPPQDVPATAPAAGDPRHG